MKYMCRLKKYCKEYWKIENYEQANNDNFHCWVCHHRLEISLEGKEVHNPKSLKRLGMYYDRPYFELIFLRKGEHIALHNKAKGPYSEERKENMSKSLKIAMKNVDLSGPKNPMYGKCGALNPFYGKHHTEQTKKLISMKKKKEREN